MAVQGKMLSRFTQPSKGEQRKAKGRQERQQLLTQARSGRAAKVQTGRPGVLGVN